MADQSEREILEQNRVLLEQAVERVLQRHRYEEFDSPYSGRVTSAGNVAWSARATSDLGKNQRIGRFTKMPAEERQMLDDQLTEEYLRLSSERAQLQASQAPEAPAPEAPAPQAPSAPSLPSYMRHVTEGGQVRYHPAPDDYEGERYYRRGPTNYLTEDEYARWQARQQERIDREQEHGGGEPDDGAAGGGGGGGGGRRRGAGSAIANWMQGAVLGGVGAGLAGAAVSGLAAPLTTALGVALEGAGATGSGVMRIAQGVIGLFDSGIKLAANIGGAVLGGAIGLMLGGAIGAAAGGAVGTVAGALGGIFSQAGRALGDVLGAAGQIMSDTARTAVNLSDGIMKLSLVSGQAVPSIAGLVTTMRLLGMGSGAAESAFGSWGQRIEFLQMRFGALGVEMARNRDGTLDWQRTLLHVHDWLQQFDPMLRQPYARALLGSGADQMMPYLQDRGQLEQAASAADELAPRADTVRRAWDELRIPLQEINILWDTLKVEFVSGFIPLIGSGVRRMIGFWSEHKHEIIAGFEELPGRAMSAIERIAGFLQDLVQKYGPDLASFWDLFSEGARNAWAVIKPILDGIREHPYLAAMAVGAGIGGARGGPGGAVAGATQAAAFAFAGQRQFGGMADGAGEGQQRQPSFWRTLGEGALTWGGPIAATLLSRRVGAGRAARLASAGADIAETAASTPGLLARLSGVGGRLAAGYGSYAQHGALEREGIAATARAYRGLPRGLQHMWGKTEYEVFDAARAGRAAPGIMRTLDAPSVGTATRGISGLGNAIRGLGSRAVAALPALGRVGGFLARLLGGAGAGATGAGAAGAGGLAAAAAPIGLAVAAVVGTALAGWGAGTWISRRFNIGGARDTHELNQARQRSERQFEGRKDDARQRGYVLMEDVAESMGLKKKWERGKLSDEEQGALTQEFRRQRQAAGRPRDSIRAEVDPGMQRRWGDWFRDLGDKVDRKDAKPVKIEGEVKVKQEMEVTPNSQFNIALMRYESTQAWRDVQLAVS